MQMLLNPFEKNEFQFLLLGYLSLVVLHYLTLILNLLTI